jgi:ubiquitin-conjugating enzyme E2 J2
VIFGLKDCQYEGGFYLGKLVFPNDYPWKPPGIMMVTENGRFRQNAKICLSISDYHPESWNPVWPVKSIIIGLISFMTTDLDTVGSIKMVPDEVKAIAKKSS